jgi:tRNA(Arg) A34 adenosine deaminase TadA
MRTTGGVHKPDDGHFMALALRQAEIALTKGQTPCGAVILDRDGQLIGEGHNTVRADQDPTAHGEVVAMRDAWRRVGDREYLTRPPGVHGHTSPSARAGNPLAHR